MKLFVSDLDGTLSNYNWIDIIDKVTNKGVGIDFCQKYYNIIKYDTYCFGDYKNDLSMVDYSSNTFAIRDAHVDVIELFKYRISSNNDQSVTNKIIEILKQEML